MRSLYRRYLGALFFSKRFYWSLAALIFLFLIVYLIPAFLVVARLLTLLFFLLVVLDYIVLFVPGRGIEATRRVPERLSNGDINPIQIELANHYRFRAGIRVIDELPVQFQRRDFLLTLQLQPGERRVVEYSLRPVERGEYQFHHLNVFVHTPLQWITRRYIIESQQTVKVYPSFFSLRKFDLMAWSNQRAEAGSRKIRKIGRSVEFEQIREYVTGDDIRTLNWKATARKGGQLMVNNYTDERSQQLYCLIDKGRVMKMPFDGMTLLDHAINAALVLSRVALLRQDRAGLVTFGSTIEKMLPAERRAGQMNDLLETLYAQTTGFGETDFEKLHALVRTRITQRSLLVLFTNFESMSGLQRQLPYIRAIARNHLLLVVFFENTALREITSSAVSDMESLYIRTIAEKFVHEKQLMVKELQQHGVFTILTPPEQLTVNTVNKYLELKARQAL